MAPLVITGNLIGSRTNAAEQLTLHRAEGLENRVSV